LTLELAIILMPLSLLAQIGDHDHKLTWMTLQFVDRSIKCPYGFLEDVLVKVNKFIFLANFVVMDMEKDSKVPLNLEDPSRTRLRFWLMCMMVKQSLVSLMKRSHSMCLSL